MAVTGQRPAKNKTVVRPATLPLTSAPCTVDGGRVARRAGSHESLKVITHPACRAPDPGSAFLLAADPVAVTVEVPPVAGIAAVDRVSARLPYGCAVLVVHRCRCFGRRARLWCRCGRPRLGLLRPWLHRRLGCGRRRSRARGRAGCRRRFGSGRNSVRDRFGRRWGGFRGRRGSEVTRCCGGGCRLGTAGDDLTDEHATAHQHRQGDSTESDDRDRVALLHPRPARAPAAGGAAATVSAHLSPHHPAARFEPCRSAVTADRLDDQTPYTKST